MKTKLENSGNQVTASKPKTKLIARYFGRDFQVFSPPSIPPFADGACAKPHVLFLQLSAHVYEYDFFRWRAWWDFSFDSLLPMISAMRSKFFSLLTRFIGLEFKLNRLCKNCLGSKCKTTWKLFILGKTLQENNSKFLDQKLPLSFAEISSEHHESPRNLSIVRLFSLYGFCACRGEKEFNSLRF